MGESLQQTDNKEIDLDHKLTIADHLNSDDPDSPNWISPLGLAGSRETLVNLIEDSMPEWFENKEVFENLTGRRLRIADIGAGDGNLAKELAEEYGDAEVVAIDRSPVSIEKCLIKLEDYDNAITVGGDLNHVMRELNQFDFIYAINVLQDTKNPEKALENILDKLRDGGKMAVSIPGEGAREVFPEHVKQDDSGYDYLYIGSNEVGEDEVPWRQYFFPEEKAREMFSKIGVEVEEHLKIAANAEDLDKILEMAGKEERLEEMEENKGKKESKNTEVNLYLIKK